MTKFPYHFATNGQVTSLPSSNPQNQKFSLKKKNKDQLSMSHLNKKLSKKNKKQKQSAAKSLEQSIKSSKNQQAIVPVNTFGDAVILRNAQKNFTLLERYTYNIQIESPIYEVKSLDSLDLDLSKTLSYKKGDLNLIQSNTVRCFMKDLNLSETKLVIKRLDCLDQNVYNLKIHETETMQRLGLLNFYFFVVFYKFFLRKNDIFLKNSEFFWFLDFFFIEKLSKFGRNL